ncbi:DoxX family protein [Alcaligenaceae bacterium CGII-47]|nr:DoxX family protein [Alcaligenaceae bacterium CGII-47]
MTASDDLGKLALRLSIGVLLLAHGLAKVNSDLGFISGSLVSHGLPSVLAYGVYIGELIAPILIILGLYTRIAGMLVVVNMLFVFGLVHMNDLFSLGRSGGWALELQGLFLFGGLAIALLGAGSLSLGGRSGRWN